MIKLLNITGESVGDNDKKLIRASLYADTKTELTDDITGEDVDGMEDDTDLDAGTLIRTASFEVGQLNSSHQWTWG